MCTGRRSSCRGVNIIAPGEDSRLIERIALILLVVVVVMIYDRDRGEGLNFYYEKRKMWSSRYSVPFPRLR